MKFICHQVLFCSVIFLPEFIYWRRKIFMLFTSKRNSCVQLHFYRLVLWPVSIDWSYTTLRYNFGPIPGRHDIYLIFFVGQHVCSICSSKTNKYEYTNFCVHFAAMSILLLGLVLSLESACCYSCTLVYPNS